MNKTRQDSAQSLGSALETLVGRECLALHRALAMRKDWHKSIHDARKACRRLRSALAFLPSEPAAESLDQGLRQLIHGFSPMRDACIATHTAQLLAAAHEAGVTHQVIDALRARCEDVLHEGLADDPHWHRRRIQARSITASIEALPWHDVRSSTTRKILKRARRKMKRAHEQAQRHNTPAASHRWRRRTRKFRYQLEWLRKARHMAGMKKRRTKRYGDEAKQLSVITDQLGWRQDFQVFLRAVEQLPASYDVSAMRRKLKSASTNGTASAPPAPKN